MKAMHRNAAAPREAEPYRPELVESDEPRYLRRQKPVEIRRKKFGGKSFSFYRTAFLWTAAALLAGGAIYVTGDFLLHSPKVLLLKPDQVEITGNHMVAREAVLKPFYKDRGRSVLRIPLNARRSEIEQISWVQTASVERVLPNRIRVEVAERTPVAFVRNGSELALIDSYGVMLDRPHGEDLHFPIVTGLADSMPRVEREKRMQTYQEFLREADLVRAGSSDFISEVDLSNPSDFRVVMAGLPKVSVAQAVTIHFGSGQYAAKYRLLVENFAQWQANNGCVHSVDLQYERQIVLNPDSNGCGEHATVQKGR